MRKAKQSVKSRKSPKRRKTKALVPELVEPETSKALAPTDPTARYLAEIRRYPLLSKEEEYQLAVQYYENKDPVAAQKLVTANLRFVVKIAAEYARFGARLIDLIQEGNLGLMQAVREFNPYKGVRLISYAVWWIRGQIQEHLMRQYSMVRIGTTPTQRRLFYQLQKYHDELERLGYSDGVKQLSGRLGVETAEIENMSERLKGRDVSLNQPLGNNEGATLLDYQMTDESATPDEQISRKEELTLLHEKLERLRPRLNDRERELLEQRLLADEPATLQEIADRYGITREAVRQMEARVIQKLRE